MSEEIEKEVNEDVGSGFLLAINKQIYTVKRSNDKSSSPYLNSTEAYSIFNILSATVEKMSESSDISKGFSFIYNKKFNLMVEVVHSDYFNHVIKDIEALDAVKNEQFKAACLNMQNDMMGHMGPTIIPGMPSAFNSPHFKANPFM